MHRSVIQFVQKTLTPDLITGKTVLEVGSRIINGTPRHHVTYYKPADYLGIDIREGLGVDLIADCAELTQLNRQFDLIITTEMLEHVADWRQCMWELAQTLTPAGHVLLTTRSPGFAYHFPPDHWRYTTPDMGRILNALNLEPIVLTDDPDCPGVFALARKPHDWKAHRDQLDTIEVAAVKSEPIPFHVERVRR